MIDIYMVIVDKLLQETINGFIYNMTKSSYKGVFFSCSHFSALSMILSAIILPVFFHPIQLL